MSIKITYFVHGTTEDNEKKLASGQADVHLAKIGLGQAKELGQAVEQNFDAVFCSDLRRAIDSANLAFGHHFNPIRDKRLRECDYGELTQQPKTWQNEDYINSPYPGGESYQDVEKRIKSFLDDIKKDYDGKHIAIVAHEAPQLALDVLLRDKTWQQACEENWRKRGAWQPGWEYELKTNN